MLAWRRGLGVCDDKLIPFELKMFSCEVPRVETPWFCTQGLEEPLEHIRQAQTFKRVHFGRVWRGGGGGLLPVLGKGS